jgi:hypothetical protein
LGQEGGDSPANQLARGGQFRASSGSIERRQRRGTPLVFSKEAIELRNILLVRMLDKHRWRFLSG